MMIGRPIDLRPENYRLHTFQRRYAFNMNQPLVSLRFMFVWVMALANGAAYAGDAAQDWLQRMEQAANTQSFVGTLMYHQRNGNDAIRIIRQVKGKHIREKVYSLTGSYREVVRDGGDVWCYLPDDHDQGKKASNAVNGFPDFLPDDLSILDSHYEIKLGKHARQAGRICQKISIVPKDRYRYGYDLYADMETGLLLAADLIAPDGEKIESYMFSDISFDSDIKDADLSPSNPRQSMVWHNAGNASVKKVSMSPEKASEWDALKPPGGFHLAGVAMIDDGDTGRVKQLVYTDGLATISVFIKKLAGVKDRILEKIGKIRQIGALNALGMQVRGHEVTVVGDVPPDAIRKIESSLNQHAEASQ